MAHYRTLKDLSPNDSGEEVSVAGWVEDVRNLGGIAFVLLRQREGTIQITVVKKENRELFSKITKLNRESVISAVGTIRANDQVRNGFEILPIGIHVLSEASAPLPLGVADKVGAELNTRLDNRFMDLRKPERRAIFHLRGILLQGMREKLRDLGFMEVHTPKLAGAGAEGGATLFRTDYFGQEAYLAQSPQLYKQMLMATGFDRVYEISPAFRAEPSDTVRHVTEFISFDGEMAFIRGQEDVLRILEEIVVAGLKAVKSQGGDYVEMLQADIRIPSLPVPRLRYSEAVNLLAQSGKSIEKGADIDTEAERSLGNIMAERGHEMFFVIEYPSAIKPFYIMTSDSDPKFSYSFDLEYRGDEMASGGQREHRYEVLVNRMKEKDLDPTSFEFYLKAFQFGMPTHGGWGLGVDRLLQKILNLPNIREVILFPHDRNRLVP